MRKAAIIGAGFIAGFHADAWPGVEDVTLCGICDTDLSKAEALSKRAGCRAYRDAAAMLEDTRPDLVSVCVPTWLHARYACMALEAGAHVLCEKPMALTPTDCERMADTAARKGRILMIGQVLRFWPEYMALRDEIRRRGAPEYISAGRLMHSSREAGHHAPDRNGGALFDVMVHELDYAVCLSAGGLRLTGANGTKGPGGSWRRVSAGLKDAAGTCWQIESSNMMPKGYPFTASFRAEYPDAVLDYVFRTAANIGIGTESRTEFNVYEGGDVRRLAIQENAQGKAFMNEIAAFADGTSRGISPVPIGETLRTMALVQDIRRSLDGDA